MLNKEIIIEQLPYQYQKKKVVRLHEMDHDAFDCDFIVFVSAQFNLYAPENHGVWGYITKEEHKSGSLVGVLFSHKNPHQRVIFRETVGLSLSAFKRLHEKMRGWLSCETYIRAHEINNQINMYEQTS
jgi:hypothetical protein